MIPKIQKILFATDLSENSRLAFDYAVNLATRYDARLLVLHVLEDIAVKDNMAIANYFGAHKWDELRQEIQQDAEKNLRGKIQALCEEVSRAGGACELSTVDILVKKGNPVEEIIQTADSAACEVIVMGTLGHGGLVDAVMGSTARRVLRRSKRPVFVVPLPAEK